MKKKTLELYLNYISFGNNAFGIESASKTYFSIPAKDLNVLQASILASIPKGPSLYNPYKNRSKVIGWFEILNSYGRTTEFTWAIRQLVLDKFISVINNSDLSNKNKENWFIKYLNWISKFTINDGVNTYNVEYKAWRKDQVLSRMFEDGYITDVQLKDSLIQWLSIALSKSNFRISAPHFVHRIIEELEKQFDTGTLNTAWLIIKTTLDLDIQKMAEQALIKNNAVLQNNWATNSAMIYLDTKNWDVLAYVGSLDYFNEQIQWQNDMVRRPRQSWSAIKPFIYALWFEKLPITIDTPIYDIPFQIWPDKPNNADDKFEWLLPLKKALGHSRNIPSAKMITALWW
jgi:penicillin-binding protein 1A